MNKIENYGFKKKSRRTILQGMMIILALGVSGARNAVLAALRSKESVDYQDKPNGDERCDNCQLWQAPNACKAVEGEIAPEAWCKLWIKA